MSANTAPAGSEAMRSISSSLATALGAPVQQPVLLVEVAFSTPRRWSSFADVTWNSLAWTKEAIAVEGLVVEPLRIAGSLVVGNGDDIVAALVLNEGVVDRSIKFWGADAGGGTALGDVVLLAEAVGASARIDARGVAIALRSPSEFTVAPRTFVNADAGFTQFLPAGSVLKINGFDYTLRGR